MCVRSSSTPLRPPTPSFPPKSRRPPAPARGSCASPSGSNTSTTSSRTCAPASQPPRPSPKKSRRRPEENEAGSAPRIRPRQGDTMNFRFDDEARPATPVRSHALMPVSPAGAGAAPAPAGPRPVRHPARPHRLPERIPASAAWQPGAPSGNRQFIDLGSLYLEAGGQLPAVTMAYETWGELNADASNAVLILHALTGDSHVLGDAEEGHLSAGWWGDLVGPGKAIDTDKYFVVAPN